MRLQNSQKIMSTDGMACGGGGLVAKLCLTLATPWTEAHQAPLSMGLSRQEYWSGLPFPFPGDLFHLGIKPRSPALQADCLPTQPWVLIYIYIIKLNIICIIMSVNRIYIYHSIPLGGTLFIPIFI